MGGPARVVTHFWFVRPGTTGPGHNCTHSVETEEGEKIFYTFCKSEPGSFPNFLEDSWDQYYKHIEEYHELVARLGGKYVGAFHAKWNTHVLY